MELDLAILRAALPAALLTWLVGELLTILGRMLRGETLLSAFARLPSRAVYRRYQEHILPNDLPDGERILLDMYSMRAAVLHYVTGKGLFDEMLFAALPQDVWLKGISRVGGAYTHLDVMKMGYIELMRRSVARAKRTGDAALAERWRVARSELGGVPCEELLKLSKTH